MKRIVFHILDGFLSFLSIAIFFGMFIVLCLFLAVLFSSCMKPSTPLDPLPPTNPWKEIEEKEVTFHGVPIPLLDRLIQSESSWRMDVENRNEKEYSIGLAQVNIKWLEYFRNAYGLQDPRKPGQAIEFAAKYLKDLYDQTGSWYEAVLAYKCGLQGRSSSPLYIRRISWWVATGEGKR